MTDTVRWQQRGRWRYGRWSEMYTETDGSVRVGELANRHDTQAQRTRSLRPEALQVAQRGPPGADNDECRSQSY